MEPAHMVRKVADPASQDFISSMPKNVLTDIIDRLPIQDAVKTGILSRNWRFNWTMLSQLVFDEKFFEYLLKTKGQKIFYRRNLIKVLLQLKGVVTKFVLYIPKKEHRVLDVVDVSHWILFLSTKGLKEFTLINMHETPLKLPTHFFNCLDLEHMELYNCCFRPAPWFRGFPNLLSFNFQKVTFESCTFCEFVTRSPSLETLKIDDVMKPFEISKLKNLKMLSLPVYMFDETTMTRAVIIQVLGLLPKLEEADLDFGSCKFLAESGPRKRVPTTLLFVKILTLREIDFSSDVMVLYAFDLIRASPNLQTLHVTATHGDDVPPHGASSWEVGCGTMGQLRHLQIVELTSFKGSENEVCLIKSLLAYSPMLKKMVISCKSSCGLAVKFAFLRKLLNLHRASPMAKIDLN